MIGHEGSSVWIAHRGTCTKRAAEHVRRATDEEMLSYESLPLDDDEFVAALGLQVEPNLTSSRMAQL